MSIKAEISVGEFLDKLTILQIKLERITDTEKQQNINSEFDTLQRIWSESEYAKAEIGRELQLLRSINEKLWTIEDQIRAKECAGEFDDDFIALARSVYITNDERARIKKDINLKLNSGMVEEKSYKEY